MPFSCSGSFATPAAQYGTSCSSHDDAMDSLQKKMIGIHNAVCGASKSIFIAAGAPNLRIRKRKVAHARLLIRMSGKCWAAR
jgi:hypothetical protein